jgi:two-component system copper resistance phosphate regulon response regulator CusR
MRVLIVEDDAPLLKLLQKSLEAEHYATDVAADGEEAQNLAEQQDYDLVILDLNLPKADGLEVLKHIRARNETLPVLALTARREVEDRVKALNLGADDYLPKPFAFAELLARTRALLRRSKRPAEEVLKFEDLELNRVERTVVRGGKPIELTPKELSLLEYLLLNLGRVVTRTMIIEQVWKLNSETMTNVVDVYVNYLRKKIDEGFETKLIQTVRGSGYQIGSKEQERATSA